MRNFDNSFESDRGQLSNPLDTRKRNRERDTGQVITEHALLPVIPGREEGRENVLTNRMMSQRGDRGDRIMVVASSLVGKEGARRRTALELLQCRPKVVQE